MCLVFLFISQLFAVPAAAHTIMCLTVFLEFRQTRAARNAIDGRRIDWLERWYEPGGHVSEVIGTL